MVIKIRDESVSMSVLTDDATLRCAGGAEVSLPREILFRSPLLQQAVTDTVIEDDISVMNLPKGVIEAWIEGLSATGVDTRLPDQERACKAAWPCPRRSELFEYLEAADFLVDKATVTALCTKISDNLFAPLIESGKRQVDTELEEGLLSLHSNLQLAVLGTSRVPIFLQLWLLGPSFHQTALHAAFPSIISTACLTVHSSMHSCELGDLFWQVLAQETGLKSLTLTNSEKNFSEAFLECMSKLTCLEDLNVADLRIGSAAAQVIRSIGCQSTLTALNLSGNNLGGAGTCQERAQKDLLVAVVKCTALRSLDLSYNCLGYEQIEALGACISQLPHLQSIDLTRCGTGIEAVPTLIARCQGLKTFHCGGIMRNTELVQSLRHCSHLQKLELPYFLHGIGVHHKQVSYSHLDITQNLTMLTDLRDLKLGEVSVKDLQALAGSSTLLTCLTALEVTYPSSGVEAAALDEVLPILPRLRTIKLWCRSERSEAYRSASPSALARCIRRAHHLQHIDLAYSRVPAGVAEAFFASLKGRTALKTLTLRHNEFGVAGVRALAKLLPHLPNIQHLDLARNSLHAVGLAALTREFSSLTSLKELDLSGALSSLKAATILGRKLHLLKSLQHLKLDNTHLGDEAVIEVSHALHKLHDLKLISMSSNGMTCSAVGVLSKRIRRLRSLEHLDVSLNRIRNKGMHCLAQCARTLPSLKVMNIHGNKIRYDRGLYSDPLLKVIVSKLEEQSLR